MLQIVGIFGLAFFSFSSSIPAGLALGVEPLAVATTAFFSYIAGVMVVILLGEPLRQRLLQRFGHKFVHNPDSRFRRIWDRFGLVGLALLAPMTIGAQVGTVIALYLGAPPRRLIVLMALGAALWAVALTVIIVLGIRALT